MILFAEGQIQRNCVLKENLSALRPIVTERSVQIEQDGFNSIRGKHLDSKQFQIVILHLRPPQMQFHNEAPCFKRNSFYPPISLIVRFNGITPSAKPWPQGLSHTPFR